MASMFLSGSAARRIFRRKKRQGKRKERKEAKRFQQELERKTLAAQQYLAKIDISKKEVHWEALVGWMENKVASVRSIVPTCVINLGPPDFPGDPLVSPASRESKIWRRVANDLLGTTARDFLEVDPDEFVAKFTNFIPKAQAIVADPKFGENKEEGETRILALYLEKTWALAASIQGMIRDARDLRKNIFLQAFSNIAQPEKLKAFVKAVQTEDKYRVVLLYPFLSPETLKARSRALGERKLKFVNAKRATSSSSESLGEVVFPAVKMQLLAQFSSQIEDTIEILQDSVDQIVMLDLSLEMTSAEGELSRYVLANVENDITQSRKLVCWVKCEMPAYVSPSLVQLFNQMCEKCSGTGKSKEKTTQGEPKTTTLSPPNSPVSPGSGSSAAASPIEKGGDKKTGNQETQGGKSKEETKGTVEEEEQEEESGTKEMGRERHASTSGLYVLKPRRRSARLMKKYQQENSR